MSLFISPTTSLRLLMVIASVLAAVSAVSQWFHLYSPGHLHFISSFLNVDEEQNLPAWYSTSILLIAALTLAIIAAMERKIDGPFRRHWAALAAIFAALSLDEACSLHEMLVEPVRNMLHVGGIFSYAWVIPGVLGCIVLGLVYLPFVMALPRQIRSTVILAGTIFLCGAIGMELPEGWWAAHHGKANLIFVGLTTVEEFLEMVGVSLFIYAILTYMEHHLPRLQLCIGCGLSGMDKPSGPDAPSNPQELAANSDCLSAL